MAGAYWDAFIFIAACPTPHRCPTTDRWCLLCRNQHSEVHRRQWTPVDRFAHCARTRVLRPGQRRVGCQSPSMTSTQASGPGQSSGDPGQRPSYSLTQAAKMTGVSLSTIKRRRMAGAFPNAHQDDAGTWLIPVGDLLAAGLHLNRPTGVTTEGQAVVNQGHDLDQVTRIAELERALTEANAAVRVERAYREAAEQIAAEREKRALTAERALLMLMPAAADHEPVTTPAPDTTPPETPVVPAVDRPRRRWWHRWESQ